MVAFAVTSCLKSNDSEATTYSDAAITSFTLGTLNRYLHTTSKSGGDSIYKKTLTGSNYAFHIDQIGHRVYNTDSLPIGTDVKHVICDITSKNSGAIILEDLTGDTLRYFSTSDSIDFSVPRTVHVLSTDGKGGTEYTISVNVHKEPADSFVWKQMESNEVLKTLTDLEAHCWNGDIYVGGNEGETFKTYEADSNGKLTQTSSTSNQLPEGIKRWIGKTQYEIYALSTNDKLMISRDEGLTWTEENIDEDESMLPVQDIAFVSYPVAYATNTEYALMVGNRSTESYPQEKIAMVWRKIVDNDYYTVGKEFFPEGEWNYMERSDNNQLALPRLKNLSMVVYDDGILAIGGTNLGDKSESIPFSEIYQSRDDGITWKTSNAYQLPAGFNPDATSVAMVVDDDNNLWLFCGGTGQVWRGRLNKLGWKYQD